MSAPSGLYWIDPQSTGTPFQVYCEMASNGGGWTLVFKIDGTKSTFAYDAGPWTDSNYFGTPDLDQTEAKLRSFDTVPFTRVRVGMYASDDMYRWVAIPDMVGGPAKTLKDVIAMAGPVPTTAGPAAWKGLVPSVAVLNVDCAEGFNLTGYNFHLRLGWMGDNSTGCTSPGAYVGFGVSWFAVTSTPNTNGPNSGNFRDIYGGFTNVHTPTWGYILVK